MYVRVETKISFDADLCKSPMALYRLVFCSVSPGRRSEKIKDDGAISDNQEQTAASRLHAWWPAPQAIEASLIEPDRPAGATVDEWESTRGKGESREKRRIGKV